MKHIFRLIVLSAILTLCLTTLQAQQPQRVPAYHGVITRVQPNGDTLHIFLRGDEWNHFTMTIDGWEIRENKKGKLCYLKLKKNGDKVVTSRQAHDANRRSRCETKWLNKHGVKRSTL